MKIASQIKVIAAVAILSGVLIPTAQAFTHIDHLANQVECQSRTLISEIRSHYRHTRQYRKLLSGAYQINRSARHIHALANRPQQLVHLRDDVERLDRRVRELAVQIAQTDVHADGRRIYGPSADVFRLLRTMEDSVHHLYDELLRQTQPRCECDRLHMRNAPDYSLHGHGPLDRDLQDRNTIQFGNGRFNFQFRF
ncbi:MAG TPA: hypothetical protein DCY79_24695 [Planctomycetaceae bacterium]|nr:hypothetical protein [Planctomycetaceae bacterium]